MDIQEQVRLSVMDGVRDGVKQKLSSGYNSPLDSLLNQVIHSNDASIRSLLNDAMVSAINDTKFREEIGNGVRHKMAQLLVQRFGGELEKQVNALKSDPATRARITLAIEEIVKSQLK